MPSQNCIFAFGLMFVVFIKFSRAGLTRIETSNLVPSSDDVTLNTTTTVYTDALSSFGTTDDSNANTLGTIHQDLVSVEQSRNIDETSITVEPSSGSSLQNEISNNQSGAHIEGDSGLTKTQTSKLVSSSDDVTSSPTTTVYTDALSSFGTTDDSNDNTLGTIHQDLVSVEQSRNIDETSVTVEPSSGNNLQNEISNNQSGADIQGDSGLTKIQTRNLVPSSDDVTSSPTTTDYYDAPRTSYTASTAYFDARSSGMTGPPTHYSDARSFTMSGPPTAYTDALSSFETSDDDNSTSGSIHQVPVEQSQNIHQTPIPVEQSSVNSLQNEISNNQPGAEILGDSDNQMCDYVPLKMTVSYRSILYHRTEANSYLPRTSIDSMKPDSAVCINDITKQNAKVLTHDVLIRLGAFYLKPMGSGSTCYFQAIAFGMHCMPERHEEVRNGILEHIANFGQDMEAKEWYVMNEEEERPTKDNISQEIFNTSQYAKNSVLIYWLDEDKGTASLDIKLSQVIKGTNLQSSIMVYFSEKEKEHTCGILYDRIGRIECKSVLFQ